MIKLEVRTQGGYHHFTAEFPTEAQAIAYIQGHGRDRNVWEIEDQPVDARFQDLLEVLYPTCLHGMSESLCMGPDHFMTADQERQLWG